MDSIASEIGIYIKRHRRFYIMFKLRPTLRSAMRVILVLAVLIVAAGIIIDRDANKFTVQTAIGQTNDTLQISEDFQHLERANRAFIDLVARTRPAVVQITTKTERSNPIISRRNQLTPEEEERLRPFFDDGAPAPFFRFFREAPPRSINPNPEPATGIGSGVIVSDDGYILTNNHVVDGTDEITVTLADGREYSAELIGRDDASSEVGGSDLAVIKIDAKDLSVLPFGDSDALEVGEWVIAIGTPLNYSQTVTRGIVSAKNRTGFTTYGQFIQTDAPINRGNSGGALINIRGELVGINTLIATAGSYPIGNIGGNIGIGFAIPSNMAQQILPQLVENGKVERGWLGITMEEVSVDFAEKLKLDKPHGVIVKVVGMDSPAQKAGIQRGDVIISFDGQEIRDMHHLRHSVGATKIGKSVEVIVLRKGDEEKRLTVKLGKRTAETMATLNERRQEQEAFAGLGVQDVTPAIAERYGYSASETGVVVTQVARGSDAEKKGIKPGFLIQEMEWITIDNLETYTRVTQQLETEDKKRILLYVRLPNGRGGDYVTISVSRSDR